MFSKREITGHRAAGFTDSQAETQAEAPRAVIDSNLATKADIALLQRDIELLRRDRRNRTAPYSVRSKSWTLGCGM